MKEAWEKGHYTRKCVGKNDAIMVDVHTPPTTPTKVTVEKEGHKLCTDVRVKKLKVRKEAERQKRRDGGEYTEGNLQRNN